MKRTIGLLAVSAAALLVASACGQSGTDDRAGSGSRNPDTFVFAAVPSEESDSLQAGFDPIIAMIEKETGKTIEFQNATDYAAVIEGMRAGKVDIAQFGPFSYVLARNQGAQVTPVGAQVDGPDEEPGYQSYGIVKAGSPITDLAGYRGKKVCFVDPSSTSGYLYPTAGLLEAGIDPTKDIEPIFAGGHDASVLAVKSGQCDAGFAYDSMVDSQLIDKGSLQPGEITTLWKSETIPSSPIAIADDLDPELRSTLTRLIAEQANVDYLKANGFCSGDCKLGDEDSWGYKAVDDALYNGVRKVCDVTKNKSCTQT
ncbi:MAG: phosphate/phosphite/phosphonate ABC transporter substrate-binding protein [Actinomycetota bacterium]|nr:phosphate/phosphite/phosphonate ABC transporter substrate-binding protein [Actinomycetota bacterium]